MILIIIFKKPLIISHYITYTEWYSNFTMSYISIWQIIYREIELEISGWLRVVVLSDTKKYSKKIYKKLQRNQNTNFVGSITENIAGKVTCLLFLREIWPKYVKIHVATIQINSFGGRNELSANPLSPIAALSAIGQNR